MSEAWLPVVGYEGFYDVSDLGRVRTVRRTVACRAFGGQRTVYSKVIASCVNERGYLHACLCKGGIKKTKRIHVLVLEAFVGPRIAGMHACHNDGNPQNNRLENLRWDTIRGNFADKRKHGTWQGGDNNAWHILTEAQALEILRSTESGAALAKRFGVSQSAVWRIRRGRNWKHLRGNDYRAAQYEQEASRG